MAISNHGHSEVHPEVSELEAKALAGEEAHTDFGTSLLVSPLPQLPPLESDDQILFVIWQMIPAQAKAGLYALAAIALVGLLLIATRSTMVDRAKMLMVEFNVVFALAGIGVFLFRKELMNGLYLLEEFAYFVKDDAKMQMELARYQMQTLEKYLGGKDDNKSSGHTALGELIANAGPLLSFLFTPQKSTFKWAMFGLKLAQNAFSLYQQTRKT